MACRMFSLEMKYFHCVKILCNHSVKKKLTKERCVYSYHLCMARRLVKNAFGILFARFTIFHTAIALKPENVGNVVMCCCVLHNVVMYCCVLHNVVMCCCVLHNVVMCFCVLHNFLIRNCASDYVTAITPIWKIL
jgi:hypothetical protein